MQGSVRLFNNYSNILQNAKVICNKFDKLDTNVRQRKKVKGGVILEFVTSGDTETHDMQTGRYLTFSIDNVMFAIEMHYITEIIGMQKTTELPDTPDYMIGIINLRGKIIPVLDVRRLFGKEVRDFDDRTCIIVIDIDGMPIGLIVDRVSEVVAIPADDVSEVPKANGGHHTRFVKNIGKIGTNVILILDCEKLINEQDIEITSEII